MAEAQELKGGCHCGAVRFTASADMAMVIECNCSHCSKKGFILTFTPAERFTLEQGEDSLTDYRFNTHRLRHRFCKACGVQPFAEAAGKDGAPTRAINLRCVDGLDVKTLNPTPWDGASA